MKPSEIYAPTFKNGDRVALIRYPHGGTFEIPQLTVNNRNREARKIFGANAEDAIGIHHTVAKRLSGADFDGDTVLVIPNNKGAIKSTAALDGLKDFDPHMYKLPNDSPIPRITSTSKGIRDGQDFEFDYRHDYSRGRYRRNLLVPLDIRWLLLIRKSINLIIKQSEKDNGILQFERRVSRREREKALVH